VTESASALPVERLASYVATGPNGDAHRAADDVAVAIAGISSPYLTRLRTRLQRSDLERELTLRASSGPDLEHSLEAEVVGVPVCGVTDDAGVHRELVRRTRSCDCAVPAGETTPMPLALAGVLAMLLGRRRG